jgi:uncharacterized protein (TIGR00661 family)
LARVLVGLSGDGKGHSSRCRATITHLLGKGHEVKIVTSGKGYESLQDYYSVIRILGLRVASETGEVDTLRTLKETFEKLVKHGLKTFRMLLAEVDRFKPEIIISDFEPFVVVIGAYRRIPLISIDNQHVITHCDLKYPKTWIKEYVSAWLVCNLICGYSQHYFITSFFQPRLRKSFIKKATHVGPILRSDVFEQSPVDEDQILLYIRTPERARAMLPLIETIAGCHCCAYGFEDAYSRNKNISFRKPSDEGFLKDLAASKAVITNGGHSLISEALYLGKPVFSIPTKGDFEQMINAYYVDILGYGTYDFSPSAQRIRKFMDGIEHFKRNIGRDRKNFDGNSRFFKLLDSKIEQLYTYQTIV